MLFQNPGRLEQHDFEYMMNCTFNVEPIGIDVNWGLRSVPRYIYQVLKRVCENVLN